MKIGDFPLVENLVLSRAMLIRQRDEGRIRLSIDGAEQAADLLDALRPALNVVLDSRIDELDQQLAAFGVDVG